MISGGKVTHSHAHAVARHTLGRSETSIELGHPVNCVSETSWVKNWWVIIPLFEKEEFHVINL